MNCTNCHDTGVAPASGGQPEEVCECVDAWVKDRLANGEWRDLQEGGERGPALHAAFRARLRGDAEYSTKNDCVRFAGICDLYPEDRAPIKKILELSRMACAIAHNTTLDLLARRGVKKNLNPA